MKYYWDESDIEKTLNELKYKLYNENPKNKSYYLQVINQVNTIIKTRKIPRTFISTRKEKLSKITDEYYYNERFYELVELFNLIEKKHQDEFIYMVDSFEFEKTEQTYIKNDDALTIMHDFFKETDEEIFKYFLEFYKNRYQLIKFIKEGTIDEFRNGSCLFIDIERKNYINITDCNGISKLIVLAHEIGHAIANLYKPTEIYNSKDNFLGEVESLFFELAFINDIGIKLDEKESVKKQILVLYEFCENADNLSMHKPIISCWENNKYNINKSFYSNLRSKNIKINMFIDSINTYIEEEGAYVTSYMVALELLGIYKQDKKEALKILKKIIKMRSQDSLKVINTFFKKFENIEKETMEIKDNMKNVLLKKI